MIDELTVPYTMPNKAPFEVPRRTPSPTARGRSPPPSKERTDGDRALRWNDKNVRGSRITQPMRDVILLGLDADVDAEKLRALVTALADSVDARLAAPPSDVTVIRDRNTGASKGFGFAKFDTLEDAKRFVTMHAPFINNPEAWLGPPPGATSDSKMRRKRIKIDYSSSERPQGGLSYYEQHNAPGCKDQLKRRARRQREEQTATEQDSQVDVHNENGGMREASAVITNTLLLTGLGADANAADVGAALQTLPMYAASAAQPLTEALTQLEQVLIVRERVSNASKQRALAIFKTKDAARACLAALRSRTLFPQGVAIGANAVHTGYADAIIFEEADPYDPTCAPWTYTDKANRTWRHEDESLGFEIWEPTAAIATPAASSPSTSPRSSISLPSDPVAPVVSNGTTYFLADERRASAPVAQPPSHAALRMLDYSDMERRICLLCQRQFKSQELLARHSVESALHQSNLDVEETCRAGAARVHACRAHNMKENARQPKRAVPVYTKPLVAPAAEPRRFALQPMGWNTVDVDAMAVGYNSTYMHESWTHVPVQNPMPMMYPPYAM
ncbi:hypothetical protein MOBT1_000777 [Malassezia obtusa]|uniref:RRM domain-containing protein n=1 Tax=Malassezia obtusa TaxID=76774 RepID=A0AAF0E2P9_9BASI|nr:hypothetical protein MOBT1_000777 [Malassezia obtusa]